jgi:tetratricopeptide (TPR) repeat protein
MANVAYSQLVTIRDVSDRFPDMEMRQRTSSNRVESGTVSLAQLSHKVPSKAQKEAALAEKAWKKGNQPVCIEHLRKAIALDPEFLEARNNLGLVYVRANQPESVLDTYAGVLKIDPHSAWAYSMIGGAHAALGHFVDAEFAARRALAIDSSDDRSRYVLGFSLAQQHKNDAEALKNLQQSWGAFPSARMVAAQILSRTGHIAEARSQLETYLPLAPASEANRVKGWLARLR